MSFLRVSQTLGNDMHTTITIGAQISRSFFAAETRSSSISITGHAKFVSLHICRGIENRKQ